MVDDKERVRKALVPFINAAKAEMEEKRQEIKELAAYRARCVVELRQHFSVVEIAGMLGVSRQTVNQMLVEADGNVDLNDTPPGLAHLFR